MPKSRMPGSAPAPGSSPRSLSRPTPASIPGSRPAPRSRRSTTRCWPRSSSPRDDRPTAIAKLRAALERHRDLRHRDQSRATCAPSPGQTSSPLARSRPRRSRDFAFVPDVIEVMAPGAQSSVQELPGRLGLWHVGVPPSGPMDARSFRHANRLVGNADETTALELTVNGPTLRFHSGAVVALAGAEMPMKLDGATVPHGTADHHRRRPGAAASAPSRAPGSGAISRSQAASPRR